MSAVSLNRISLNKEVIMTAERKGTTMHKERSHVARATTATRSSKRKMKFRTRAPEGSEVFLVGSFNNWDPRATALQKDGDGCYETIVSLPVGRHEYKFLVNGDWLTDALCQECVPNEFGSLNNVVEVC
jgi:1,4-alpha-glucan branching enzyme